MKLSLSFMFLFALLSSCATIGGSSGTMTAEQKKLLVQDIQDALAITKVYLNEDNQQYLTTLEPILVAFATDEDGFDYEDAFNVLLSLEPVFKEALIKNGMEQQDADAIMAVTKILLRRVREQAF